MATRVSQAPPNAIGSMMDLSSVHQLSTSFSPTTPPVFDESHALENTAFILSIFEGDFEVNHRHIGGRTALMYCAEHGYIRMTAHLVINMKAQIDLQDDSGRSALMWAFCENQLQCFELLLELGANPNLRCEFGGNIVTNAALMGNVDVIVIIHKFGADLNARDGEFRTPLMNASLMGHLNVVEYLIGNGADLRLEDEEGMSALDIAQKAGQHEIGQYIMTVLQNRNRVIPTNN